MPSTESADPTVNDVAARVLAERSAAMDRLWTAVIEGDDPESLHDLRVNARRVQAALRLFRDALPKRSRAHASSLKRLIRTMGTVRELDVMLTSLEDAIATTSGDRRALEFLRAQVATERDDRSRAMVRQLHDSGWMKQFRSWVVALK